MWQSCSSSGIFSLRLWPSGILVQFTSRWIIFVHKVTLRFMKPSSTKCLLRCCFPSTVAGKTAEPRNVLIRKCVGLFHIAIYFGEQTVAELVRDSWDEATAGLQWDSTKQFIREQSMARRFHAMVRYFFWTRCATRLMLRTALLRFWVRVVFRQQERRLFPVYWSVWAH